MGDLLRLGITNALMAAALAGVVGIVSLLLLQRRPAVAHALWLVVLLKLLTPPVWSIPVELPTATRVSGNVEPATRFDVADIGFVSVDPIEVGWAEADVPPAATASLSITHAADAELRDPVFVLVPNTWLPVLLTTAGVLWAVGSAVCLLVVVLRSLQFRRLLQHATPATDDLALQCRFIASRFGICHPPDVWFVPGAVCPMLYAFVGRARLLLPRELWERLDTPQRDTLVAHELAHLHRRDHWVRLVEVAATVLYWWNPVVWWARRQLREAEEQCCDAWVTWSMPTSVRDYMSAILDAVEFVSENKTVDGANCFAPAGVPALASGMGEFRRLERRLRMIRRNDSARRLGRPGMAAVFLAAGVALPLAPSLAQEETPRAEERRELILTHPDGLVVTEAEPRVQGATVVHEGARIETAGGTYEVKGDVAVTGESVTFSEASIDPTSQDGAKPAKIVTRRGEFAPANVKVQFMDPAIAHARAAVDQARANLDAATKLLAQLEKQAGQFSAVSREYTGAAPADKRIIPMPSAEAKPKKAPIGEGRGDERIDQLERRFERLEELLMELRDTGESKRDGERKSEAPAIGWKPYGSYPSSPALRPSSGR